MTQKRSKNNGLGSIDLDKYLSYYSVGYQRKGNTYLLNQCLFDPNHKKNESAIIQDSSGLMTYSCFHESCNHIWPEVKQAISGDDDITRFCQGDGSALDADKENITFGLQPDNETYIVSTGEEVLVYPETVADVAIKELDMLEDFQRIIYNSDSELIDEVIVDQMWNALINNARENISKFAHLLERECGTVIGYKSVGKINAVTACRFIEKDSPKMQNVILYGRE